jgi:hypothetical protein
MGTPTFAALSWAMLLGCSSDGTNPGDAPPVCAGPVTIAVSSGTSPSFSWTPACRLFFVNVELGATDQWSIISDSTDARRPRRDLHRQSGLHALTADDAHFVRRFN